MFEHRWNIEQGEAVAWMNGLSENSVDLVIGSPPYCDARTYGIDAVRDCQTWVEWMLQVTQAATRISRGLVLWVVAGVQRKNCYWPAPEGLAWEWWKRGNKLWAPAVWWKVDENDGGCGIPGSGGNVPGKRWLRKDWEYVLAFHKGHVPWDHPEIMGHLPVCHRVGGEMSNRMGDGRRINAKAGRGSPADPWGTDGKSGLGGRRKDGQKNSRANGVARVMDAPGGTNEDGTRKANKPRPMPKLANPGNVLRLVVKARVGGGHMGSDLCHDNEAPFPEALVEFFVRSYCPSNGVVCDPFCGSGTTPSVALRLGRRAIACDLRQEQVDLAKKRMAEVKCGNPVLMEE